MKSKEMRYRGPRALPVAGAIVTMSLLACAPPPMESTSGACCQYTGPAAHDCAAIENLGPGADLDGRCNAVNQGQSCSWIYSNDDCCQIAVNDGFGDVQCPPDITGTSGACCQFSGPVAHDCAAIENLGPGADLDGRCNQVNQGQSCSWFYSNDDCCQVAVNDGFPGSVQCN